MDAYRAGFNRGSADKIARRPSDDAVPPKYRVSDVERRSFKRGYKDGYASPSRRSPRTGAEREMSGGEAMLKQIAINDINDLIRSKIGGDEFVDKAKSIYDKTATDADDLSKKHGLFDPKYLKAEIGEIVYGKALEMKASPKKLATISYMATSAQLAASPKPGDLVLTKLFRPGAFASSSSEGPVLTKLFQPGAVSLIEPVAVPTADASKKEPGPVATQQQMTSTSETRELTAQQAIAAAHQPPPSWISVNWPWVAAGTAVVAAGGGYLYYRSKQNV